MAMRSTALMRLGSGWAGLIEDLSASGFAAALSADWAFLRDLRLRIASRLLMDMTGVSFAGG